MREPTGNDAGPYLNSVGNYKAAFCAPLKIKAHVGNEKYFIVGCGTTHRHEVHKYNQFGMPIVEYLATNHCYTIDVDKGAKPHRIGSFWTLDHTEDIPGNHFEWVVFENLPRVFFENPHWCVVGLKTAFRITMSGGWVVVRTAGMQVGQVAGDNVREALGMAGFNTVTHVSDNYGIILAIWAYKP